MKSALFVVCAILAGLVTHAQEPKGLTKSKNNMKQFSLLVRVPDTYDREQAKLVNPQWDQLLEKWKNAGVYILSFAFPGESFTVSGNAKSVKKETVLSGNLRVVSNIVVQAENIQDAVELAKMCPVLPFGGTVEIREITSPVKSVD